MIRESISCWRRSSKLSNQKTTVYGANKPLRISLPDCYWDVLFAMAELEGRTVEELGLRGKEIMGMGFRLFHHLCQHVRFWYHMVNFPIHVEEFQALFSRPM
jgi:hypothetical protein